MSLCFTNLIIVILILVTLSWTVSLFFFVVFIVSFSFIVVVFAYVNSRLPITVIAIVSHCSYCTLYVIVVVFVFIDRRKAKKKCKLSKNRIVNKIMYRILVTRSMQNKMEILIQRKMKHVYVNGVDLIWSFDKIAIDFSVFCC